MPAVRQIRVLDPLSLGHHLGRPSLVSQPGHDPSNTRGQIVGEFRTRRPRGSRECPHDHVGAGWQARQLPRHQVAQLPGHPMADHGSPHGTTHDESPTRRQGGLRGTGVDDDGARGSTGSRAHHDAEVLSAPDPSTPGQHDRLGY